MDDKTLLQLLQSDAEAGIKAALDLYGGAVETICKNFLINLPEQDLEEAIADTFIKLWQNSHHFKPDKGHSLKSYIYSIARNTCIDILRKQGQSFPIPIEEITLTSHIDIENDFIKKSTETILHHTLEAMKEPDRTIFILRYFYLEPIAKIAARTGCTSGKVKNILYRGKSKLEAALKERGISNE